MCFGGGSSDTSGAYTQAAAIQQQGAADGIAAVERMYQQARADVGPWRDAGQKTQPYLAALYGIPGYGLNAAGEAGSGEGYTGSTAGYLNQQLQNWPGYKFLQQQALGGDGYTGALDRAAAARGMALSGAQLKGATNYAQNMGLTYALQPYLSGVTGISNQGLQAGGMSGNWAMQAGNQIAGLTQAGAQAQASGLVNAANASAANNSGNDWLSALGVIGGLAAAPFTGGTSLIGAGASALGGLGSLLSSGGGSNYASATGGYMSTPSNYSGVFGSSSYLI